MGTDWSDCQVSSSSIRQAYDFAEQQVTTLRGGKKKWSQDSEMDQRPTSGSRGGFGKTHAEAIRIANKNVERILRRRALNQDGYSFQSCEADLDHDGNMDTVYFVEKSNSTASQDGIRTARITNRTYLFDLSNNGEGIDLIYHESSNIRTDSATCPNPLPEDE